MEIEVDTASSTVTLNISGTFTADQLRQLIERVGHARAQLGDEPLTPDGLTLRLLGHRWHTEPLSVDRTITLLLICLPGLGWQGITLEAASRQQLIQLLITQESFAIDGPGAASSPGTGH